jgi:hypothetical protein
MHIDAETTRRPAAPVVSYEDPRARDSERFKELRAAALKLVERSILTLRALPDRDARFLANTGSGLPRPVRDASESYGWQETRPPRFQPTPRDVSRYLEVLGWLTWLERVYGDEDGCKVIVLTALKVPMWKIAQRMGCSDRTISRWRDIAFDRIVVQFYKEIERLM